MQAQFYLMNLSFRHDPAISLDDLGELIYRLAGDMDYIREHGDKVYKHESIYEEYLLEGYKVMDIYDPDKEMNLPHGVKKQLLKLIDHNETTTWSNEEVIDLIKHQESEDLCKTREVYGLIALQKVPKEIPEDFVMYDKRDWIAFHRYFLGKFPCDEHYFFSEAGKCFPELFFHTNITRTLGDMDGGWKNFSVVIVTHLSKLNDIFPSYLQNRSSYQRIEALKNFSAETKLDVTPEGDAKKKPMMTFSFTDEVGIAQSLCCEPHMKISRSDRKGDNKYYQNRIYFHEGSQSVQEGKILVGHIGKHIEFS